MFHMSKKCGKNAGETFDPVFYFQLWTSLLQNLFEFVLLF